jgi:glycosyltransferase involved in cell wall biosynthesis
MKVIYLHQYFKFPDENGGTRSYDLAASFVKEGFKVVIVTASSDERLNDNSQWVVIERNGLEVHYIYLPYSNHMSYFHRSFVFLRFLWLSTFRLLKLNGDVVLATSTPLTICVPAIIKKWFGKTPFIFEVRDVWPETVIAMGAVKNNIMQNALYGLEKLVYKNADAIVPLSTDMQKSIISRYPNFRAKTNIVIENIAEINRFRNNQTKINLFDIVGFSPRFSVLYAGTFGKVNGIHKLIELAEKTLKLDNELVYILIGSGAEKQNVLELAIEKDLLNRNVFILDPVSKSDLPSWYNAVSMGMSFVINVPELWANSANKFFDALAASKPILINYEGWQAEMIRSRNIGYVLSGNISDNDAEGFVAYSYDTELVDKQKFHAHELAKEKYSLEFATKRYLKVFENIGIFNKIIQ